MPASGAIAWIAEHEATIGKAAGVVAGVAVIVWSKLSTLRVPKSWVAEDAKGEDKPMPIPPPALPAPSPATGAAPHDYLAEMHALRIQLVHLEEELTAVQQGARTLRKSHDAAVFENAAQSKALYAERAANEELRGKAAALLAEMTRLRAEGPRSAPPPRGRRER